jgi:hypothetical protein
MAKTTRRFTPRLEAFDERCLPSVTFNEVPNGDPNNPNTTWTLQIVGDSKANDVAITDDGTGLVGAITVIADGQSPYFSQHAMISQVQVATGGGVDVVDYTLTADMVFSRSVIVNLGARGDTFSAHLGSFNIGRPADENGVYARVDLNFQVSGEGGADTFNVDAANHVRPGSPGAGSNLFIGLVGGRGRDVFNTNYSVTLDPTDTANPSLGTFFHAENQ